MTKRQESRSARRSVTTTIIVAVLAAIGSIVGPAPAQAAVPAVAQTWSSFMYRSLTVTATGKQLRQTLAAQRTAVRARTAEATRARAALAAAQRKVATGTSADATARHRVTAARRAVSTAKQNLSRIKPRQKAALTRARNTLATTRTRLTVRTSQARAAATALAAAKSARSAANRSLTSADRAVRSASAAVVTTQQKIAALQTPARLAARAAELSRDVVTAVRPRFATTDTVVVHGTTVHRNVAYAYRRMVDDAGRAGIAIKGGGFRTKQRQTELRKINGCPDVWTAPSSSCRVPTAIPGRSLHEIGMAVDITSGGRSLTAKSPAFAWLKANAHRYGFRNLPSEPWHWSITGG